MPPPTRQYLDDRLKMKTVLMIAPYFIPRRRVGALRPFKFAVHLENFGFKPVVLTIDSGSDRCSAREEELLKKIEVIELRSVIDRTQPEKRSSMEKAPEPRHSSGLGNRFLNWIDRHTPVDTWIYFFRFRYRYILKRAREVNPDLIWATGDPWSSLWLGEKLSRVLNKPLITDFRDPWTLSGVNLRKRSPLSVRADRRVEERIIANSGKVVFTSAYTGKIYRDHYSLPEQKCEVIYNSIDSDLLPDKWEMKWESSLDPAFFNILFFGRFRRLSPVSPAISYLEKLERVSPELAAVVRLHSFGLPDQDQRQEVLNSRYRDHFVFHKPVLPEMKRDVLQKADLLLLTTHPERDGVIPAKFWDYLDSGKPILSLLHHPEVHQILSDHHAGYQPVEKRTGYDDAAKWTCRLVQNPEGSEEYTSRLSSGSAQQIYSSLNAARKLATLFNELLK